MKNSPTPETPPETSPSEGEGSAHSLPQLSRRLMQLAAQLDALQGEVDKIAAQVEDGGAQVSALVSHLTDTQSTHLLQSRLAEFTEQMSSEHEQLNFLEVKLADLATQEQIVRLAATVATQGQVSALAETLQNLVRGIEKANHLGETKEQQLEGVLGTLQEIVARRQQAAERDQERQHEQTEAIRRSARGELAADLLPALDGLEVALERARTILARQRHDLAALGQLPVGPLSDQRRQPPPGLLDKLRSRIASEGDAEGFSASPGAPLPESMAATVAAMEAWLNHLTLVRDRFSVLLSQEGIRPITTLHQKFDPRLHLAVDSEERGDVPPDTIVRELRKGYRQDHRVLRYAEVVVSRAPDALRPAASPAETRRDQPGG